MSSCIPAYTWYEVVRLSVRCSEVARSPLEDVDKGNLYDLAHVTRWEPYDLHDLTHVSAVGSVVHTYRSCTTFHNGGYRTYFR